LGTDGNPKVTLKPIHDGAPLDPGHQNADHSNCHGESRKDWAKPPGRYELNCDGRYHDDR
jgi:hypothetical protein